MYAKDLRIGSKVVMMGRNEILEVIKPCSQNCHEGNDFWFVGKVVGYISNKTKSDNDIGYQSEFNVDFAKDC